MHKFEYDYVRKNVLSLFAAAKRQVNKLLTAIDRYRNAKPQRITNNCRKIHSKFPFNWVCCSWSSPSLKGKEKPAKESRKTDGEFFFSRIKWICNEYFVFSSLKRKMEKRVMNL